MKKLLMYIIFDLKRSLQSFAICKCCLSNHSKWNFITFRCVKDVQTQSCFWSPFSCIRTEYRKVQTRRNSVFGHFSRSVFVFDRSFMCRFSYRDLKYGDIIAKADNNTIGWMDEDGLISVKIKNEKMKKMEKW